MITRTKVLSVVIEKVTKNESFQFFLVKPNLKKDVMQSADSLIENSSLGDCCCYLLED